MSVTEEMMMDYIGIDADYADDSIEARVDGVLSAAEMWLEGAVGHDVDMSDPRAVELVLMCGAELYEKRALTNERLTQKVYASMNRIASSIILQLQYEEGA